MRGFQTAAFFVQLWLNKKCILVCAGLLWLTTAAISAPVLWLMQASTRDDKKKKKVLAAVFTRSYRKTQKHQTHMYITIMFSELSTKFKMKAAAKPE